MFDNPYVTPVTHTSTARHEKPELMGLLLGSAPVQQSAKSGSPQYHIRPVEEPLKGADSAEFFL